MRVEELFHILYERCKDEGLMFLVTLEDANEPLLKDKLKDQVNNFYKHTYNIDTDLIKSRHTLDTWTSRLEGAGLVDVKEVGRARMYSITDLGRTMIEYAQTQK